MSTRLQIHEVKELKVMPVERVASSSRDCGYFYTQEVVVVSDDGSETTFCAFFTDAVSKRLERERIEEQRIEEMEMRAAMEQAQASDDMAGLMGRFSIKR